MNIKENKTMKKKGWNDKCGVFGIWNDPEAAWMTYLGLYAQQHRGQEGAGIVSLYKEKHLIHRGAGLVGEVFNDKILQKMKGEAAIGHTRYSTHGGDNKRNIQPLTARIFSGPLAVSHNGNIVNFIKLKKDLMRKGSIFYSSSDTECIIHLLAHETPAPLEIKLQKCLPLLEGAYNFVFLTKDSMVAVRDPMGFRPLVLGQRIIKNELGEQTKSWVIASETCAFDLIGAKLIREIEPGEIWTVNHKQEVKSYFLKKSPKQYRCIFEHVYFSRPDSYVFSRNVYNSRKKMGQLLVKEKPTEADLVIPIPDSGMAAAIGYHEASGITYDMGIVRNHYIGRTFIHPSQSIRDFKVKIKLSAQKNLIFGKKIVVIDDSLVRGTTSKAVVEILREAGAKEIHFRVSSPPIISPCFYGVDTPEKQKLIACRMSVAEIQKYLEVDSLYFLSQEGLKQAVQSSFQGEKGACSKKQGPDYGFCTACFTGNYPTNIYTQL